jgi:hypothetical protein
VAAVVYGGAPAAPAKAAAEPNAPTFFRVWSSDQNDPEARTGFLSRAQFSLTDAAKKSVAGFDRVAQSTAVGCTPKAMPILMGQPLPIELEDRGTTIVLKLEEYDAVRTIHMTAETAAAATGRSPLGYSAGHWDDGVLVVETDRIDAPYFNSSGVPLGPSAKTIERFWLSDEGRRLSYELVVIDADTFTAPARAKRAWLGRDGERLLPYDCRASPR